MKISFDSNLNSRAEEDLSKINKSYLPDRNIVSIASTFHHETGERAYVLGYIPSHKAPAFTLIDIGFSIIALYMEEMEMSVFDNSIISWNDGYIQVKKEV